MSFLKTLGFAGILVGFFGFFGFTSDNAYAVPQEKEWTILVYLNGHNSLDSFGPMDLNEMEKVGSTDQVNVVVQWASSSAETTKRLLVKKDTNSSTVTSPIVENMPRVDMGDYKSLIAFVRWGVANYPAKHYMIDIWNHGAGWHRDGSSSGVFRDISNDDLSGHKIKTEELGLVFAQIKGDIGRKIDIVGSDACLMAMAEVASEYADSVDFSVGSEDLEPGEGWPYDTWLSRLVKAPKSGGAEVSKMLVEEYVASYNGGSQGSEDATLSALDLSHQGEIETAIGELGRKIQGLNTTERAEVVKIGQSAQKFYFGDYRDLGDFINLLDRSSLVGLKSDRTLENLKAAFKSYVVTGKSVGNYTSALGVSFWMPGSASTMSTYGARYQKLKFNLGSHWFDALDALL